MSLHRRFRGHRGARDEQRGQGLVEFAMLVPVFMILLLGMLEFGYVFDHTMTVSYATREGARAGSAFAAGNTTTMVCNPADGGIDVDKNIVAAVQRVLQAPGSQVKSSNITNIKIYLADTSGAQVGTAVNTWTYQNDSGPSVDGAPLDFIRSSWNWNACNRVNNWNGTTPPDSIGVSITYNYTFITPLSAALGFFGPPGGAGLTISDRTVMALNPTD